MPLAGPWLEHVFALHLQQVLRSDALTQEQRRAGKLDDTQEAVIAFADLVGFTELGESVPVEELGSVAGRLSRLAGEALEPPVRLVKLIGDAVMLVSPEPEPMLDATLRLVDLAAEDEASRRCARASPAGRRCTAGATGSARRSTSPAASRPARGPRPCSSPQEVRDAVSERLRVLRRGPQEAQGLLVAGARLPRQKGRRCSASSAWALTQTGVWRPVRE